MKMELEFQIQKLKEETNKKIDDLILSLSPSWETNEKYKKLENSLLKRYLAEFYLSSNYNDTYFSVFEEDITYSFEDLIKSKADIELKEFLKEYYDIDDNFKLTLKEKWEEEYWQPILLEKIVDHFDLYKNNNFSEKVCLYVLNDNDELDYETKEEYININAKLWTDCFNLLINEINNDPKYSEYFNFVNLNFHEGKYKFPVMKNHEDLYSSEWGYQEQYPNWQKSFVLNLANSDEKVEYNENKSHYIANEIYVNVPVPPYKHFSKDLCFDDDFFKLISNQICNDLETEINNYIQNNKKQNKIKECKDIEDDLEMER